MNTDPATGLPELPTGQRWKIERDHTETEPRVTVSIVTEITYRQRTTSLYWLDGHDPEETLTQVCRADYGDRFIRLEGVSINTIDFGQPTGRWWNRKPAPVSKTVSGAAVLSGWQTLETSEDSVPATPRAIEEEARNILDRVERGRAAEKLLGLYPPNKLEDE